MWSLLAELDFFSLPDLILCVPPLAAYYTRHIARLSASTSSCRTTLAPPSCLSDAVARLLLMQDADLHLYQGESSMSRPRHLSPLLNPSCSDGTTIRLPYCRCFLHHGTMSASAASSSGLNNTRFAAAATIVLRS
jgi:hypothetical protein